jgi:GAF domain-containing protein
MEHRALRERAESTPGDGQELTIWTEAGAQMWVPLVQQGELEGVLVLGGKQADEYHTGEDHDILATLSHHVASAIARARHLYQAELRPVGTLAQELGIDRDVGLPAEALACRRQLFGSRDYFHRARYSAKGRPCPHQNGGFTPRC